MTWRVEWTPAATASLQRIHWRDAERVVAAVEHFATTGEGRTYRIAEEDDAVTARMRVGSYRVKFTKDTAERLVVVWVVYRS